MDVERQRRQCVELNAPRGSGQYRYGADIGRHVKIALNPATTGSLRRVHPGMIGLPRGIRTPDRRLRRPMLYPAELWAENGTRRIVVMYAGVINAKQAGASSSHQIDPEKRPLRQNQAAVLPASARFSGNAPPSARG